MNTFTYFVSRVKIKLEVREIVLKVQKKTWLKTFIQMRKTKSFQRSFIHTKSSSLNYQHLFYKEKPLKNQF